MPFRRPQENLTLSRMTVVAAVAVVALVLGCGGPATSSCAATDVPIPPFWIPN